MTDELKDEMTRITRTLKENKHTAICHEYWERGLECRCIPEGVKQDIRNGAKPEDVM